TSSTESLVREGLASLCASKRASTHEPISRLMRSAIDRPTQKSPSSGAYLIRARSARQKTANLSNIQAKRDSRSPRPEDFRKHRVPLLLIVGREHRRQHLLLVQHLHDARRIGIDIEARRQPAELGEELLRLLAQHEVACEQRGLGMRRLRVD